MEEQLSTERGRPRIQDLYASTRPDLVRLAHVITGSNHLAEEVVQDAFLALRGLESLRQELEP